MRVEPTRHRYPARAVATEYFYSVVGMAFTFVPLALTTPLPAITGVLAVLGALFLAFGLRTVLRHNTTFELSETGIASKGMRRSEIRWDELRDIKVSYFSTKRDRSGGWMQLRLKSNSSTIRVDSTVDGFPEFIGQALGAARRQDLNIEAATLQNLVAIGLIENSDGTSGSKGAIGR